MQLIFGSVVTLLWWMIGVEIKGGVLHQSVEHAKDNKQMPDTADGLIDQQPGYDGSHPSACVLVPSV